jgi:hypothetical protein
MPRRRFHMESLLAALERFKDIPPENMFRQLFEFFECINRLDKEGIIAFHQAFEVFCARTGQRTSEGGMGRVKKAIIGRMTSLCCELGKQESQALAWTFYIATNVEPDHLILNWRR